jgi:WD40 repeat protein
MLTAAGTTAELWNDAGQLEMVMPHPGEVATAAFSADGKSILTATKEGTAFLWAVEDRRALPREVTYAGWDRARLMTLSPDARFLLTQWVPERRVLGFRPTQAGGMEMVTEREGETAPHLQCWEVATGRPLWAEVPYEPEIEQAVFSPDGSRVVTIDKSKVVRCWDTKTGKPLGPPFQASERNGGDSETPGIIAEFSPDGGRLLLVQNLHERANANGDLRFVCELRMLDPSSGVVVGPVIKLRDHVHGAAFRRSGDVLIADGKGVEVWPANGDALAKEPLLKTEWPVAIALSPDERTLCALTRNAARLWDMASHAWLGAPVKKAGMTEVHTATFSPNSRLLLTRDGSVARLWDARTSEPVGQPFELGENFHFGQGLPRFADDTHLLAPRRSVVQQKDLSLLLGDATPEAILRDAQLFTHRRLNADGDAEVIPAGAWEAMRRGRVVH